jgi:hypothetical protein
MALTTRVDLRLTRTLTNALDLETPTSASTYTALIDMATGTGAGLADMTWSDQRTLSASATEDLDLAAALTGPLGTTLTFARVKAVLVKAASGNTNDVQITRPASNGVPLFLAASDGIAVKPGGLFLWVAPNAAGVAVTAGTGDLITVTNSAGSTSVTYDVIVVGASA